MQKWHFQISGNLIVEGMEDQIMNIYPENIALLIKVSDYENENMPRLLGKFRIDKNLFDIIAKNAKTATMYLKIEKFDKQDDTGEERNMLLYSEAEYSIFVEDDINYNKDIDYPDLSNMAEEKQRTDVYKEVSIGLIPKDCIEANKTLANLVFYKTTMINMCAYYLQELHPLIEKFTYNPEIPQLVIPPKETLAQTIDYLNEIKVFYDTKYLFFIDEPLCTYLISRSGKGIQKKDDVYPEVFFNIHATTDKEGLRLGMTEDAENNRYYIDISVKDTKYTINHDIAKIYTDIQQIINPDKSNTVSALKSVVETAQNIKNTLDTVKSTTKSLVNQIKNLPNTLFKQKMNFKAHVNDFIKFALFATGVLSESGSEGNVLKTNAQSKMQEAYDIINNTPTYVEKVVSSSGASGSSSMTIQVYVFGSSSAESNSNKQRILNTIYQNVTADHTDERNIQSGYPLIYYTFNQVNALQNLFSNINDKASKNAYNLEMFGNKINCYSEIDAQDGVDATTKNINNISSISSQIISDYQHQILDQQHYIDDLQAQYMTARSAIKSALDYIQAIDTLSNTYEQLKAVYDKLDESNETIQVSIGGIKDVILNFKDIALTSENVMKAVNSKVGKDLINIYTKDLKSAIKGIKTSIGAVTKSIDSTLKQIQDLGKLSGSLEHLTFGLGDLYDLAKSIDAIGDLTGIGRLGKSTFSTALKLGQIDGKIKKAVRILNTKNDNSNKIKGIKADMENKINQITLNKYDLDPGVFTPNKRYIIKNYDGHSDKDGIFLLQKKTEIFIREDDTCSCNVVMEFTKVANTAEGDKKATEVKDSQSSINNTTSSIANDIVSTNKGIGLSAKVSNTSDTLFDIKVTTNNKNNDAIQILASEANKALKRAGLEHIGHISTSTSNPDTTKTDKKILGGMSIHDIMMTMK